MQMSQIEPNQQLRGPARPPGSESELYFQVRQHQLRKHTDILRTQIFALMDELCHFLNQNPDYKLLESKIKDTTVILSQKSTQQLVETIKKLENHVRESVQDKEYDLEEANKEMEQKDKELRKIKNQQNEIHTKSSNIIAQVLRSKQTFSDMQRQLSDLTQEYRRKREDLLHAQVEQDSYQRSKLIQLNSNWSQQIQYIKEIIQERMEIGSQMNRVNCVFSLLQQKFQELDTLKREFLQAKRENDILFSQNKKICQRINDEKGIKQNLLENKRNAVLNQEIQFAGVITQKWNQTQQAAHQILFQIINEVNNKLPQTQLRDVQTIIEAAEEYYRNEMRSLRVEHIQDQRDLNNQQL